MQKQLLLSLFFCWFTVLNAHELDVFLFFAMIDPKNKLYEN